MTRLVGGLDEIKRTVRDAAVGDSPIRTTGIGAKVAGPSRSGVTGAVIGAAGVGGTGGDSQSHRRQWQPGESAGVGAGEDFPGWLAGGASSLQQDFALEVEAGEQQDRFLAPGWQHDFAAGAGIAIRSGCGAKGVLAGAAQAQA